MENAARTSIGIFGLGKMGSGIAEQALGEGFRVVGFDILGAPRSLRAGLIEAQTLAALASALECPRAILRTVIEIDDRHGGHPRPNLCPPRSKDWT